MGETAVTEHMNGRSTRQEESPVPQPDCDWINQETRIRSVTSMLPWSEYRNRGNGCVRGLLCALI